MTKQNIVELASAVIAEIEDRPIREARERELAEAEARRVRIIELEQELVEARLSQKNKRDTWEKARLAAAMLDQAEKKLAMSRYALNNASQKLARLARELAALEVQNV